MKWRCHVNVRPWDAKSGRTKSHYYPSTHFPTIPVDGRRGWWTWTDRSRLPRSCGRRNCTTCSAPSISSLAVSVTGRGWVSSFGLFTSPDSRRVQCPLFFATSSGHGRWSEHFRPKDANERWGIWCVSDSCHSLCACDWKKAMTETLEGFWPL